MRYTIFDLSDIRHLIPHKCKTYEEAILFIEHKEVFFNIYQKELDTAWQLARNKK